MKEATGELSTTVIAVVAIAAVAAIFTVFVLPLIKNNIKQKTRCASATCSPTCTNGFMTCTYQDEANVEQSVSCPC